MEQLHVDFCLWLPRLLIWNRENLFSLSVTYQNWIKLDKKSLWSCFFLTWNIFLKDDFSVFEKVFANDKNFLSAPYWTSMQWLLQYLWQPCRLGCKQGKYRQHWWDSSIFRFSNNALSPLTQQKEDCGGGFAKNFIYLSRFSPLQKGDLCHFWLIIARFLFGKEAEMCNTRFYAS